VGVGLRISALRYLGAGLKFVPLILNAHVYGETLVSGSVTASPSVD
jgi:hypothetical protein